VVGTARRAVLFEAAVVVREVGLHLSPWRRWMEAQEIAYKTRDPGDIAAALAAFREATKFKRETPETERFVSYKIVNT
jgi:hypothetical protein